LVDEFLRSGFTHLLFIDADIHFDPRDVIALLALDKDVIGAPYPKKSIKWASAQQATVRTLNWDGIIDQLRQFDFKSAQEVIGDNKDEWRKTYDKLKTGLLPIATKGMASPGEIEKVVGDYVFNAVAGTGQFSIAEPLKVMEIGTGFMMVKREVFPLWAEQYPEFRYKPDHVGQANFDGSRYIHAFFDTVIDYKNDITLVNDYGDKKKGDQVTIGGSDRYLSEDYAFCQLWRNMGGDIWLCPWVKTHHIGTYAFTGDMQAVAQYVGAL